MRRWIGSMVIAAALSACASSPLSTARSPDDAAKAATVMRIVEKRMAEYHLKSAIVKVTIDGREIVTAARGESMTGVPATTDMHFRNGAVAISYVSTLLLLLAEEKDAVVSLDDKVAKWLPHLGHAGDVTLGQLANMTSGYRDYVLEPALDDAIYANPFRQWKPEDLLAYVVDQPLWYAPGTNWNYAHTNYVILGLALEKATGRPMTALLQEKVLGPLGLDNTRDPGTAAISAPALHAYSSERRSFLKIPAGVPFYEESTFWSPSWTITRGAIQTTNVHDMNATAVAIGTGALLTPASYRQMVSTRQRDFGGPVPGCASCRRGNERYTYGMGVVINGHWLLQNPLFHGFGGTAAYLPSQKIAIAVAVTLEPEGFDENGDALNRAQMLFEDIGTELAPDDPPVKG